MNWILDDVVADLFVAAAKATRDPEQAKAFAAAVSARRNGKAVKNEEALADTAAALVGGDW